MKTDLDAAAADALRAAGDPLRWRILQLLAAEELCVCHLVEMLGVPQSLVSHHLGILRGAGLVTGERFRYWTYYRLRTDAVATLGRELLRLSEDAPPTGEVRRPCC